MSVLSYLAVQQVVALSIKEDITIPSWASKDWDQGLVNHQPALPPAWAQLPLYLLLGPRPIRQIGVRECYHPIAKLWRAERKNNAFCCVDHCAVGDSSPEDDLRDACGIPVMTEAIEHYGELGLYGQLLLGGLVVKGLMILNGRQESVKACWANARVRLEENQLALFVDIKEQSDVVGCLLNRLLVVQVLSRSKFAEDMEVDGFAVRGRART